MRYRKEFVSIWKIDIFLFVAFLTENLYNKKTKNPVRKLDIRCLHFTAVSSCSLPPPIKAGRFPFAQNLVKLSRSLNRFHWQDSLFSLFTALKSANAHDFTLCRITMTFTSFQVELTWDLVRDSGQRKLTYSSQNHCTSPRIFYLSRRLYSHWERLIITHHLQKWESSRLI